MKLRIELDETDAQEFMDLAHRLVAVLENLEEILEQQAKNTNASKSK